MTKPVSAVERYRSHIESREAEIVDVTVPSGFVFKFKKPSKFSILFQLGSLPASAVNNAVEAWQKEGIAEVGQDGSPNKLKMVQTVLNIRDKVLELSHDPKLVVGPAKAENELSTDHVSDTDLEYLFKWVSSGGDASVMLATFPAGSQQGALAGSSRKKQRATGKRSGGD